MEKVVGFSSYADIKQLVKEAGWIRIELSSGYFMPVRPADVSNLAMQHVDQKLKFVGSAFAYQLPGDKVKRLDIIFSNPKKF